MIEIGAVLKSLEAGPGGIAGRQQDIRVVWIKLGQRCYQTPGITAYSTALLERGSVINPDFQEARSQSPISP